MKVKNKETKDVNWAKKKKLFNAFKATLSAMTLKQLS